MRRSTTALLASGIALAGLGLGPAMAAQASTTTPTSTTTSSCPSRTLSTYLSRFGDDNDYFLAPGGDFEYNSAGWTRSFFAITSVENEPYKVMGSGGNSLMLMGASSATSSWICMGPNEDSVRFFVKTPGVAGSTLDVTTTVKNSSGVKYTNTVRIDGGQSYGWHLSPRIAIPNLLDATGTQQLQISIVNNTDDVYKVDDILVDPWRFTG